jgi:steroid 5-alpha reductase family enzyme
MRGGAPDAWVGVGVAVWVVAVAGEWIADRQLARFRADPGSRGRVCRAGLWRYSRHPNYFFEWLHWWAYVPIGHAQPLTFLGPAAMLLFLLRVTGIPYAERQALASRGEAYRAYQRATSAFLPWPPRGVER